MLSITIYNYIHVCCIDSDTRCNTIRKITYLALIITREPAIGIPLSVYHWNALDVSFPSIYDFCIASCKLTSYIHSLMYKK